MSDLAELRKQLRDRNPLAKLDAAYELARLGNWEGRAILVRAADHKRPDVRTRALRMLGDIGATWTVKPITAHIRDRDTSARGQAILALGKVRRAAVIPALVDALSDKDPERREDARVGLRAVLGEQIASILADEEDEDDAAQEPERVRMWWQANKHRFEPDTAYDRGEPVSLARWIAELAGAHPVVARALNDELTTWTGNEPPEGAPRQLATRWRAWWRDHGARFQPGRRYFAGQEVE